MGGGLRDTIGCHKLHHWWNTGNSLLLPLPLPVCPTASIACVCLCVCAMLLVVHAVLPSFAVICCPTSTPSFSLLLLFFTGSLLEAFTPSVSGEYICSSGPDNSLELDLFQLSGFIFTNIVLLCNFKGRCHAFFYILITYCEWTNR